MDSQDTDSKSSKDSENGSQIIITSKPAKNRDDKPIFNDIVNPSKDNSTIGDYSQIERQQGPQFVLRTPISKATAQNFSAEGQTYWDRNPTWVNPVSSPTSTTRTVSSSFYSAAQLPKAQRSPQSDVETKHNTGTWTPLTTSDEQHGVRFAFRSNFGNSNFSLSAIEGPGVWGLMSRLTSFMSSRSLDFFEDDILNNFNMEVGAVASRVEVWRQRLEDERTHSARSQPSSAESGSSPRSNSSRRVHSIITDEIHHLIRLIRDLMCSRFGRFSWGLFGIEDRIKVLLERGSHLAFPISEILLMNIWRMLKHLLELNENDTEKSHGMHSVAEAINNAFCAIRSLIHLGKAYRNAHESSDSEYTAQDLRSLMTCSKINLSKNP